jgi:adhesin transport system outer membrane protein
MPSLSETQGMNAWLADVDWIYAAARQPQVEKARQDVIAAQQRIAAKKAEQFPQLYLRVDQPIKSANNDISSFVGLRYTPGAGFSTALEAQALASRAASTEQAVDSAMRDATEGLMTDRDEFQSSRSRMQALEKAVKGSETVLLSYSRQFNASRKTWLDLMNAVRELAQNQYVLADAQASMAAALYRLQVRMAEPVQPTH